MVDNIPGTTILRGDGIQTGSGLLSGIFTATKGLMLSQVKELTGLEVSTLQNWVKRGWVSNPRNKRYDRKQVARILIINALRDCMQLENIAFLMQYINGVVDDRSDDIIDESELYGYLCTAIERLKREGVCDPGEDRPHRSRPQPSSGGCSSPRSFFSTAPRRTAGENPPIA
jgi:DNA-binding transcriptional MerR regulator